MKDNSNLMTDEEFVAVRNKVFAESEGIQQAREKVRESCLELLEIDPLFADYIKQELQQMIFAKDIVTVLGAGASKKPIDAKLVVFYLRVNHNIHVKEENISFDFDNNLCYIKLTDDIIAKVQMKNATGIKSLIPHEN